MFSLGGSRIDSEADSFWRRNWRPRGHGKHVEFNGNTGGRENLRWQSPLRVNEHTNTPAGARSCVPGSGSRDNDPSSSINFAMVATTRVLPRPRKLVESRQEKRARREGCCVMLCRFDMERDGQRACTRQARTDHCNSHCNRVQGESLLSSVSHPHSLSLSSFFKINSPALETGRVRVCIIRDTSKRLSYGHAER